MPDSMLSVARLTFAPKRVKKFVALAPECARTRIRKRSMMFAFGAGACSKRQRVFSQATIGKVRDRTDASKNSADAGRMA